jgi:ferredoxin
MIMADNTDKVEGNVDGDFYVDSNCIDCDLCRQTAPDNFDRNEDEGFSYVSKQPENEEEEQQCRDAIEECPVEAIGDDG